MLAQCDLSTVTRVERAEAASIADDEIDVAAVTLDEVSPAEVTLPPPRNPQPPARRKSRPLPPIFWILVALLTIVLVANLAAGAEFTIESLLREVGLLTQGE